ncbi:hypothetical protein [Allofournierella massiliensis]|nr:hypothetical protein [Fournierella massiliensis]
MRFKNLNPAAQMDASRLTAVPPFRLRVPQAGSFLIVAQKALFHKRNNG